MDQCSTKKEIKGKRKQFFKKLLTYYLCDNIQPENLFSGLRELVFREKTWVFFFYYNAIFKDCALFKYSKLSIEIDIIIVKKHIYLFKFCEKVCKIKVKKRNLMYNYHFWHCIKSVQIRSYFWSVFGHFSLSVNTPEYAYIWLYKQGSEYASGPKYT